ncbi:MAG: hypothetical protein FJW66_02650 [Actinobacteria bacterium]|nr:hypothetical protein [Actinomycetota bacterium]
MPPDNQTKKLKQRALTFAVPGSKIYINDYYRNNPASFLNISITGSRCSLMCRHCRAELLKDMVDARGCRSLINLVKKYQDNGSISKGKTYEPGIGGQNPVEIEKNVLQGILLSGGFNSGGKLPISEEILDGIREIKAEYPLISIYIHTGFLTETEALTLKNSGVDAVLTNLISSRKAIQQTYNLKGKTYGDYLSTIKTLKRTGLKTSPHIISGFEDSRLSDELKMVEDAVSLEVDSIVFVILKKASRQFEFSVPEVPHSRIIELVKHARKLSEKVLLSFGCAKPPGKDTHILEIGLIKAGIDSIAFPAEKTVEFVMENKIAHAFVENCCVNL